MTDIWGNLEDSERQTIKSRARKFTEDEINERFDKQDDVVVFRILRKTDRALAGILDVDLSEEELEQGEPIEEEAIEDEEAILSEPVLEEEIIGEYEISEIALISPDDFDYEPEITAADKEAAKSIDKLLSRFEGYYAQDSVDTGEAVAAEVVAEAAGLPPIVDHREKQSLIKNQGGRGTCVAHASIGLLEAYDHIPDNLSEQCLHYKFNEFLNRPHNRN